MAKFIYFSGDIELQAESIYRDVKNKAFGTPVDFVPVYVQGEGWNRGYQPVTRTVEYKSNPSKHICDARCVNATGRVMKCECSCGGKNHGRGYIVCEAA